MKRFPAKILLFGEYGLLLEAKALALPFHTFGGQLKIDDLALVSESKEHFSMLEIDRFVSYFEYHGFNKQLSFPLDLHRLKQDIKQGLYFDSNIPLQYGVGSSGALCAALFYEYSSYHQNFAALSRNKDLLESLKNDFAIVESYFHGTSSGIDPLVSFLDRPILFDDGHVSLSGFDFTATDFSIFLIDTKIKSPTGPLVQIFLKKMKESLFEEKIRDEYLPLNSQVIDAFIANDTKKLFDSLSSLVRFQLDHLSAMIPDEFALTMCNMQRQGIYIKLLGSGGGGYLLAFVPKGETFKINESTIKFEL